MHGKLAKEILKTIELIIGKQKNTIAIKFLAKENTDILINKYKKKIKKLNIKNGIIFFVDIWGGSPFNAANKFLENIKNKYDIITGTNIPMLLEVFMSREDNNIHQLIKIAKNFGKKGIKNVYLKSNKKYNTQKKKYFKTKDNNNNKMKLQLVRIDDRLIHGQVSTGWSREFKIERIIVVNDEVSKDILRTKLLKQVSPPGITSHVVTKEKFIKVYNNPKYSNNNILLLFTNPKDIVKIIKNGVNIKSINIGGMSYKKGKKQITDAISVDKEDIDAFLKLHKMNIELEIRKVPNDKKINLIKLIK